MINNALKFYFVGIYEGAFSLKNNRYNMEKDMNNFMKAIDTLTAVINGSENRKGTDRRKNKQRKRKNERRIAQRRK